MTMRIRNVLLAVVALTSMLILLVLMPKEAFSRGGALVDVHNQSMSTPRLQNMLKTAKTRRKKVKTPKLPMVRRYTRGSPVEVAEPKAGLEGLREEALAALAAASQGQVQWNVAHATYYESYAPCCKGYPTYNASANTEECTDYEACKYVGEFAGYNTKTLTLDEVKTTNIVSYYDKSKQNGMNPAQSTKWFRANIMGKTIEVMHPVTKKTMIVKPLDTCSDANCENCCSTNAHPQSNILLDFEIHTALKFWGADLRGRQTVYWRWV